MSRPLCEIYEKILAFFKGDKEKATLWFETPNPCLGGVSPYEMIAIGREEKLLRWIEAQLEGNIP